ncbi:motility protein A [Clostridium sediminicola]|uniref:motility protein A n=1 Tax=Clostridium sediminicola TaxID=3114879 RepID=UPI0031F22C7A
MKSNLTAITGLFLGLALIIGSIILSGDLTGFISASSFLVTMGGSFMALTISESLDNMKRIPVLLKIAFSEKKESKAELMDLFLELSKKAKKEGFNSLEKNLEEMDDEFLKRGLLMVIDAMDVELIKDILNLEIEVSEDRHAEGQSMFKKWAEYAPSFGMIGTIIGLINMLGNLDDASSIGSGMAVALVTTFYGALFANLILIPIATNLENKSNEEMNIRYMMVEGVLAIQKGLNPMAIEEKLQTFLSPKERLARKNGDLKVELENA